MYLAAVCLLSIVVSLTCTVTLKFSNVVGDMMRTAPALPIAFSSTRVRRNKRCHVIYSRGQHRNLTLLNRRFRIGMLYQQLCLFVAVSANVLSLFPLRMIGFATTLKPLRTLFYISFRRRYFTANPNYS